MKVQCFNTIQAIGFLKRQGVDYKYCSNCFKDVKIELFSHNYKGILRSQCNPCRSEIICEQIKQRKMKMYPDRYMECPKCFHEYAKRSKKCPECNMDKKE